MKYDLSEFEKRVEQGLLRKSEKGDLVLYGYTDRCTFERAWDEYTIIARGLILNKNTGKVVAKPFPKFFNMGERDETFLANLPDLPYTVSEKVDGSLGIVFNYQGEWQIATRGSFYSDQAIKGFELLKKYDLSNIAPSTTLLVEIVYPENKIIVNYGNQEELVLLAAFSRSDGYEYDKDTLISLSHLMNMRMAESYNYTIEEMIALQKTLPKDNEGFVVRFQNGLRVKIKGDEYMRISKLMSSLSPIALWETMKKGKVDTSYLMQLPEELRKDYEPYVLKLESQFKTVFEEIKEDFFNIPFPDNNRRTTPEIKKWLGLYLDSHSVRHSSAMFPFLLEKSDVVEKYVMKQIRPDGNAMRVLE